MKSKQWEFPSDNAEPLLTARQIAERTGRSIETVRRYIRKGIMGVVRGPFGDMKVPLSEAKRHFTFQPGADT